MDDSVKIDIIILSYAKVDALKALTVQTIDTLLQSEDTDKIAFNVVVIESNKSMQPYQFEHSTTIYPDVEFGFNRYLNIGLTASQNALVCLCNNDLVFHKGWATEILKQMDKHPNLKSANPFCDDFKYSVPINPKKDLIKGNPSNLFKGVLTGWCIFIKREIIDTIGLLDERFVFWYADRDYGKTLLKFNITHGLVLKSVVTHLGNQSHKTIDDADLQALTFDQKVIYENKWGEEPIPFLAKAKRLARRLIK